MLEALEGLLALRLRAVGVHDRALDAVLGEVRLEAVGAVLGAREDERARGLVVAQEVRRSSSVFCSAVTG